MATFTSKTLIPGQTPVGQNRDGSYIYEEVMSKATTAPKPTTPLYTPPTPIPTTKTPLGFNFMPAVDKEFAKKQNAPVKDTLGLAKRIDETSERTKQLREHFDYLKNNNELFLNDKQTDYIKRVKEKYPDYANAPDAILYGKILLADPKVQEKYGNIGEKTFLQRVGEAPMNIIESLAGGIDTGIERYGKSRELMGRDSGLLGYESLKTGAAFGGAVLTGIVDGAFNAVGDIINTAVYTDAMKKRNLTSATESLSGTLGDIGTGLKFVKDKIQEGEKELGIAPVSSSASFIYNIGKEFLDENPEAKGWLLTAEGLSNLIGLGLFGGGKKVTEQSVKEILKKVNEEILQKSMTGVGKFGGKITTETFEAGMNKGLTGGLLTGAKTTNEWLKQLPDETQKIAKTVEKNVNKNKEVLEGIRNTQTGEKILSKADNQGFDPIDDISRYEDLQPTIDADGRIDTTQAIDNLNTFVEPKAKTVRELIVAENKRISLDEFASNIKKEISGNKSDIVNNPRWRKVIDDAIETARRDFGDANGTIPLEVVDDIKKSMYDASNFLNPDDTAIKAIARGAKKTIEDNVLSADIKALNQELARWYSTRSYLKSIGVGKVIKGGRMGKYFAKLAGQGAGAIAGGAIGGSAGAFVGGIVGGEVADVIQGKILSGAIKKTGGVMPESELFGQAKKTLGESPKQLMPPSTQGLPTNYSSIYSREAEQLGRGEFPGNNNTGLSDIATPKSVTPVVSGPGQSLAVSIDNGTIDVKKALEQFDKLTPEEKAKALQGSDKLRTYTEARDISKVISKKMFTPEEKAAKMEELKRIVDRSSMEELEVLADFDKNIDEAIGKIRAGENPIEVIEMPKTKPITNETTPKVETPAETVKEAPTTTETIEEVVTPVKDTPNTTETPKTPQAKPLSSKSEVKYSDSIEEQTIIYHGSPFKFEEFKNRTTFFTTDKEFARRYSDSKSFAKKSDAETNIYERVLPKDAKMFRVNDVKSIEKYLPENEGRYTKEEIKNGLQGFEIVKPKKEYLEAKIGDNVDYDGETYFIFRKDKENIYGKDYRGREKAIPIKEYKEPVQSWVYFEMPGVQKAIKKAGYDGYFTKEKYAGLDDTETIAIFNPNILGKKNTK